MTIETLEQKIDQFRKDTRKGPLDDLDLDQAISEAKDLNYLEGEAKLLDVKAVSYRLKGDITSAYDYDLEALAKAYTANNKEVIVKILENIGGLYMDRGLFEQALQFLLNALEIAETNELDLSHSNLYVFISITFFKQNLIESSMKYLDIELQNAIDFKFPDFKVYLLYLNKATLLIRQNKVEEAEAYIEKANQLVPNPPEDFISTIPLLEVRLSALRGAFDVSKDEMKRLYDIYFVGKFPIHRYDQVLEWANILLGQDQLSLAEDILMDLTDKKNDHVTDTLLDLYWLTATLYESNQNFEKAAALYKLVGEGRRRIQDENQRLTSENTLRLIELTKTNRALEKLSYYDGLTGCFNRTALDAEGEAKLDQLKTKNMGLIMFDVDYFKQYNDNYGHGKGDLCLKGIVEIIVHETMGLNTAFYRYGGDEFILILDMGDLNLKELMAKLLMGVFKANLPHEYAQTSDRVSVTLGGVSMMEPQMTLRSLMDLADVYLYRAKYHGRGCACADGEMVTI